MGFENVSLWFAKDENENIVTVGEVDSTKNNRFVCPICGSAVIPKALESIKIQPHFAHINASECSNESMFHWWYKNKFLLEGDVFIVETRDEKIGYVCASIDIEKRYIIGENTYCPDITITTQKGDVIYVEYNYKNKKKPDNYVDIWIELGNTVIELDIKTLLQSNKNVKTFKPLFYDYVVYEEKRNTKGKYSVINKYIDNEMTKSKEDYIDRIKKLNWFWKDLLMFKRKEIDIDHIVMDIDNMYFKDANSIPNILKKLKCIDVLEEYMQYKLKKYIERLNELKNEFPFINSIPYQLSISKNSQNVYTYHTRFNNSILLEIDGQYGNVYNENIFSESEDKLDVFFLSPIEEYKREMNRKFRMKLDNQMTIVYGTIFSKLCEEIVDYFQINHFANITLDYEEYDNTFRFSYLNKTFSKSAKQIVDNYKGVGRINHVYTTIIDSIINKINEIKLNTFVVSQIDKYVGLYDLHMRSRLLLDVNKKDEITTIKLKLLSLIDTYQMCDLDYDIKINENEKLVHVESIGLYGVYRNDLELIEFLIDFLYKLSEIYRELSRKDILLITHTKGEYHVFK